VSGVGESVTYSYPTTERVLYGSGAIERVGDELARLGAERALLLSTPSLRGSTAERRLGEILGHRCVGTTHDCAQHVPLWAVDRLIAGASELDPDMVVTLGGGSVIDGGKALCAAFAQRYDNAHALYEHRIVFEYPDRMSQRPLEGEVIPHLAIPTTLSAAEYDGIFGMTHEGTKDLYNDRRLAPRVVVLDPGVTGETPSQLWAGSGVRALDHAVEIYLSRAPTPMTDAASLHAVKLLFSHLRQSIEHPDDEQARLACMQAAWLSMIGVENVTLGLSHGIGHQIGARCGVPHGITSCVMLPTVMAFMAEAMPRRLADLARVMGSAASVADQDAARSAPGLVRDFIASLGLPTRLSQVGVGEDAFELIADDAMADFVVAAAPVTVTKDDVVTLLTRAL
jgi:alcohol dehydrogenase